MKFVDCSLSSKKLHIDLICIQKFHVEEKMEIITRKKKKATIYSFPKYDKYGEQWAQERQ